VRKETIDMCGRFAQPLKIEQYVNHFQINPKDIGNLRFSYNIAPTQMVSCIILNGHERVVKPMRWGLIPAWANNMNVGTNYINARKETVNNKSVFKKAFYKRRCIIPATGFYEWKKSKYSNQPYFFTLSNKTPMALAGIWETWKHKTHGIIHSFAIVTTQANPIVLPVHARMPLIIDIEEYDLWLESSNKVANLNFQTVPTDLLTSYPVSHYVNNIANDGPECIQKSKDYVQKSLWE